MNEILPPLPEPSKVHREISGKHITVLCYSEQQMQAYARAAIQDFVTKGNLAPVPAVPEGWKLVPIEPTPSMLVYMPGGWAGVKHRAWQQMLSAAPQPAQQVAQPIPDAVEWYGGVKTDEEIDQQAEQQE